jgi:hypothetical protein
MKAAWAFLKLLAAGAGLDRRPPDHESTTACSPCSTARFGRFYCGGPLSWVASVPHFSHLKRTVSRPSAVAAVRIRIGFRQLGQMRCRTNFTGSAGSGWGMGRRSV